MAVRGFSWVIEGELAGMARPDGLPEDWAELQGRGVSAVVDLSEQSWQGHRAPPAAMRYLHLPIREFAPPTREQVDRFVAFCDEQIGAGGSVAAHCLAGRGRTGTMIACFLVSRGLGPEAAIRAVRRVRPGSIETAEQEAAVYACADRTGGL
jgi:atypical dual specificity phosphatase